MAKSQPWGHRLNERRMSKRKLTTYDLERQLREQLGSLTRSAELFDQGYEDEARRMSVILRVLLHSGRSPSLLKQLGRDGESFIDTAEPFDPENLLSTHSLVSISFSDGEISYTPRLDSERAEKKASFSTWWKTIVFSDTNGFQLSRADMVLTAADQDGGAHVDSSIRGDYAALRFENSLGWVNDEGNHLHGDPGYAAIRQIGHEVLKTLIPGYSRSREDVSNSRKQSEISGGKLRFFPHEKKLFVNQTNTAPVEGQFYLVEAAIDSVTTGNVRMIVNSRASDTMGSIGVHRMVVQAGKDGPTGVFGEFTDAVIDRVSIRLLSARV